MMSFQEFGLFSFLMVTAATLCQAHLCLISPPQRGALGDLNTKGSAGCFQVQGPCGSLPTPAMPSDVYIAGSGASFNLTVVFQKNLDHFNAATPGYFSVSLGSVSSNRFGEAAMKFKELARVADSAAAPSLFIYSVTVPIPNALDEHYVLQVSYVTKNPQAPAAFYQCTDFGVVKV